MTCATIYGSFNGCGFFCFVFFANNQKEFGMNETYGGLTGSLVYIGLVISSLFSGICYDCIGERV